MRPINKKEMEIIQSAMAEHDLTVGFGFDREGNSEIFILED